MGGFGSGRPRQKGLVQGVRTLNVNVMGRAGCLKGGSSGHWGWYDDGEEVARIAYASTRGCLVLNYRFRAWEGEWEPVEQRVELIESACTYGGSRVYFRCPGTGCSRRSVKLYSAGKYFLCRKCYGLAYASQSEKPEERMLRRANKLRVALGGEPGMAHWIAPRPKGMWQSTYDRMVAEILTCENRADELFLRRFGETLELEA